MAQRWHTLNLLMIGAAGGDTGGDPCGDRGLCSRPPVCNADFSCALIMASAVFLSTFHHCIGERVAFSKAGLSLKRVARGLHSRRLASCLNLLNTSACGERATGLAQTFHALAAHRATLSSGTLNTSPHLLKQHLNEHVDIALRCAGYCLQ